MGMFSKNGGAIEQKIQMADSKAISSIIDTSMKINGEVTFKGKARIDGQVDGNITGEHLILSGTGVVNGDVTVASFICQGKVEGNIKAELITAKKTCSINGKLESGSLTVEPGATITGEMKTLSSARTAPSPKPATIKKPAK